MAGTLFPVASADDWAAMHALRRLVLFAPRRHKPPITYREDHPDDREPGSTPFLWRRDGEALGTVRYDRRGADEAIVRLVAVAPEARGQGIGRQMMNAMHNLALTENRSRLLVNSAPDAVGFYTALGWTKGSWDPSELIGLAADAVQMERSLAT